ncbi:MAG: hypothetical protein GC129_01760 [Proteobacteria bacterium]|nr:hypothetical protein [Pseudomonadota bacterium]
MTNPLLLPLILAFFAAVLFIGWRTHTGHNKAEMRENFLIGNRAIPGLWVAIGITMGWFDATQFGFTTGLAFDEGLGGGLAYAVSASFAFFLLAWAAPRLRQRAAQTKSYMIGNAFARTYSPRVGAMVGVVMALFFLMWMSIQLVVGGQVLGAFTHLPPALCVGAILLVTYAFLVMGGFLATIRNDLALSVFFLIMAALLFSFLIPDFPHWLPPLSQARAEFPSHGLTWFNLFMLNILSTMVAPDVWQRIFSSHDGAQARKGMLYTALLVPCMTTPFIMAGWYIKAHGLAPDASNLSVVLLQLLPAALTPLIVLVFMAAVMSTIATTLFGAAMNTVSDIGVEQGWLSPAQMVGATRWVMLGLMAAAVGIALLPVDVVTLGLTTLGVTQCLTPLALCLFFSWKPTEPAAFYSLAASLATYAAGAYLNLYTGPLALLPLLIATGTLLLFQGLTQPTTTPRHAKPRR